MGRIISLKQNGVKMYNRITDLQQCMQDNIEKECFKYKSADIIREVADNAAVTEVNLDMYCSDIVHRIAEDRYDDPDYVYGTRITFTLPFDKNFRLIGEYRWQSEPVAHKHYNLPTELFTFEIRPIGLPTFLFGEMVNSKVVLRKQFKGPFNNRPVDLNKYIGKSAVSKYKKQLMKEHRTR